MGQPLEKCSIPPSPSAPCTHFTCYLHLRRGLRQQMLQKRELLNVYSDSAQLLGSTPPPLSFVSYSWALVWMGFCLACSIWDTAVAGGFRARGRRNLVIKRILMHSAGAGKHSTHRLGSHLDALNRRGEQAADTSHRQVYLHEPFMK